MNNVFRNFDLCHSDRSVKMKDSFVNSVVERSGLFVFDFVKEDPLQIKILLDGLHDACNYVVVATSKCYS